MSSAYVSLVSLEPVARTQLVRGQAHLPNIHAESDLTE